MILTGIILVAIFVGLRFWILRSANKSFVSIAAPTLVVIAFVLGRLLNNGPVPETTANPVAFGTAEVSQVPQTDAVLRNVSSECTNAPSINSAGVGWFDALASKNAPSVSIASGSTILRNHEYMLSGWAADADKQRPATGVCLDVDGHIVAKAISLYGVIRPDVAAAMKSRQLAKSGYRILIPPNTLSPGWHLLQVAARSQDGSFGSLGHARTVFVK